MKTKCELCNGSARKNGKIQNVPARKLWYLFGFPNNSEKYVEDGIDLCTKCRHMLGITTKLKTVPYIYEEVKQ